LNNIAWIYARAEDAKVRDAAKAVSYAQRALLAREDVLGSDAAGYIWGTLAESHYAARDYPRALAAARIAYRSAVRRRSNDLLDVRELLDRCVEAAGATDIIKEP
jgi:hypothetical protein